MRDRMTQGTWIAQEARMHINILRLRAVCKACHIFLTAVCSHHVLAMSDNTTAVYYINKQGGTRSPALYAEVVCLWKWCMSYHILLAAAYLAGTQNVIANTLSRNFATNRKWVLHNAVVMDVFSCWGTLTRDSLHLTPTPVAPGEVLVPTCIGNALIVD